MERIHVTLNVTRPGEDLPARTLDIGPAGYSSFGDLAAFLFRRKWALVLAMLLGLAAGWGAGLIQKPVYRAAASLEIQIPNDDYMNRRQLEPSVRPGLVMLDPFLQTEMRLLQSDTLLSNVAESMGLASHAEFRNASGPPDVSALLEALREQVEVRLLGQTQIVEVAFEARDPKLAAAFVNTLVDHYAKDALSRRSATAGKAADLLAKQLEELGESLHGAQSRLREFISSQRVVGSLERESVAEAGLRRLQNALIAAQEARVLEESKQEAEARPDKERFESETLARYRVKLTELRQRLAESSEVLEPAHFKVRQIEAEIAQVEQAMAAELRTMASRSQAQLQSARTREQSLLKDYEREIGNVTATASASVRFNALKHEADDYQVLYDNMLQRVKEARIAARMPASNVHVVDPAAVPRRPVRPKKPFLAAVGACAGILFGVLFIFWPRSPVPSASPVSGQSRHHFRDFGVIPHFSPRPTVLPLPSSRAADARQDGPELACWWDEGSVFAASLRRIANEIFADRGDGGIGGTPAIIGVTSARTGEGRTTLACNLAICCARMGRNVLLLDADHQRPRVQRIFGLRSEMRPMAVVCHDPLKFRSSLAEVWATDVAGVLVMPFGPALQRAITPENAALFIDELRKEFGTVVMDLPPVSDDEVNHLASFLEGVVFLRERVATDSSGAIEGLERAGGKIIGTVVNQVRPAVAGRRLAS